MRTKFLSGRIAALCGTHNLAVLYVLSRLLPSVRPLASIRAALAAVLTDTPLAGVALMLPLQWLTAVVMPLAGALHPAQRLISCFLNKNS